MVEIFSRFVWTLLEVREIWSSRLILRKITKILVTICEILMHHIRFRLRSAPDLTGVAYSAPPRPHSWILRGPISKVREGGEEEGKSERLCSYKKIP